MNFLRLIFTLVFTAASVHPFQGNKDSAFFSRSSLLNKARHLGQTVAERKDLELGTLCQDVESLFQNDVTCECNVKLMQPTTMNCTWDEVVCGPYNKTCGRPSLSVALTGGTLDIEEMTTCVHDFQQNNRTYDDLCVTTEFCKSGGDETAQLCDCDVSYGATECSSCNVCTGDDGDISGIELDCTNINSQVITRTCQEWDFNWNVPGRNPGSIPGFVPKLEGICAQLEDAPDSDISCDCSSSEGGTFDIACQTNDIKCIGKVCGQVSSSVSVVEGMVEETTTCVDFTSPDNLEMTCTTMQLCPRNPDIAIDVDRMVGVGQEICGCGVVYNGTTCDSCQVCDTGDGKKGVSVDCSNVHESLVFKGGCQEVTMATSYSFVPEFETANAPGSGSLANNVSFTLLVTLGCFLISGLMG